MIENGIERESCLVHLPDDIEYTSPDHIFMKGMIMAKANTIVGQHAHTYGHTSLVASGSVKVWKEDLYIGEYKAPAFIFIEEKAKHRFLSLEDNTHVYCIHNVSDTNDKVLVHENNFLGRAA